MKDKTIRRVLMCFLCIAAVIVAVAFAAVRNITRSIASSDWVNHTHSVILQVEAVRSDLYLADGAVHTFAMTGDARDRAACEEQMGNVDEDLEITKALVRDEPAQAGRVSEIEALIERRLAFLRGILAARQKGDADEARTLLAADAGGAALREVQKAIDRLKNEELDLLTGRDTASYLEAQAMRYTVWSGVALDALLLAASAWLIRDDIAARRRLAAALQETNETLERKVWERTTELASSNTLLSAENLERQWANQALEHQLRYNILIIDSIKDLVFVVTKALNISRVNPAVTQSTGFSPEELVGRPLSSVVRIAVAQAAAGTAMVDPIAHAVRSGRELRDHEAVLEDRLGRRVCALISIIPLRERDKVVGAVATVQSNPAKAEGGG